MSTIIPVVIIIMLGACTGRIARRFVSGYLQAVVLSGALAAVLWILGSYLLLVLTAPGELGDGFRWQAFVYPFLISSASALLVCLAKTPARAT